jgi:hypothetical protein
MKHDHVMANVSRKNISNVTDEPAGGGVVAGSEAPRPGSG